MEYSDSIGCRRHISTFGYGNHTIGNQRFSVFFFQFILGCTRQGNISLFKPRLGTVAYIFGRGILVNIFLDAATIYILQFHNIV